MAPPSNGTSASNALLNGAFRASFLSTAKMGPPGYLSSVMVKPNAPRAMHHGHGFQRIFGFFFEQTSCNFTATTSTVPRFYTANTRRMVIYSGLKSKVLATFAHFSRSLVMYAPNAAGVELLACSPAAA